MEPNREKWRGDHLIDPALVPGVLLSNAPIIAESPSILDLAPTVLELFGLEIPAQYDGRPLKDLERS